MKGVMNLFLFVILIPAAHSSWQTYQNDLRNSGFSDGVGYFPLQTSNFSSNVYGMDFQPLVDDLDSDNENEIIIFSNKSIMAFDRALNISASAKVGELLGQPALFDFDEDDFVEVIFNSRQDNKDYFLAYELDGGFKQEFNITMSNDVNFSGIKCANISSNRYCIFKDRQNHVHVVDMASRTDASYPTSANNETRRTVPAIGDIDNDGNADAVFWHNDDGTGGYGLIAFDIANRNVKWKVDNIFLPFMSNFVLKGQPVLVDLNNDNKLEIAVSIFYDDIGNRDIQTDWFTELFVYASNGTKLFSKCETLNGGCNDGGATGGIDKKWDGTNPFAVDFDKNGFEDICFIKDRKLHFHFVYMALNCYDYSGAEIANVNVSHLQDGIGGTAMAADMNNDGLEDIIISHDVFAHNGSSIFHMPQDTFHPIAVDVDGNGGLDLLWSKNGRMALFLDSGEYSADLAVGEISFFKADDGKINVSVNVKNFGKKSANAKIEVYNSETLERKEGLLRITGNGKAVFDSILALEEGQKVVSNIDFDNGVEETDETNNFASKEFIGLPHVFVFSDAEPSAADNEFRDYIKNSLVAADYTTNENEADIKVYIGKNNPFNKDMNTASLDNFGWGYDYGSVIYFDQAASAPYGSLVAAFNEELLFGKNIVKIMIAGNDIEGDIAGVKEFIKNQEAFLNEKDSSALLIGDENPDAVRIYDYLHLPGNNEHYKLNNEQFRRIIGNVLNDRMFSVEDKSVTTDEGVPLRLRNLNPMISDDYLEYLSSTGMPVEMPVLLARGIHSNLTAWEILGSELANEGRDAWLIEVTGGPGQDCDSCPNYDFSDLTDDYWPALVNGVLAFTGADKIQYVGHSNGGRVAIVSLQDGMIDSDKVDTFIGVAVPSAFEGYSSFGNYFGTYGNDVMDNLADKSHVSLTEIGENLRRICLSNFEIGCGLLTIGLKSDNKMSFSVDKQYYLWIINETDEHIGENLQLDNFYLIQGWVVDSRFDDEISHDFIVTEQDEKAIYRNILSPNKKHYKIWGAHTAGWSSASLPDRDTTKTIIKDALNKKPLNKYKSNEVNST